MIEKNTMYKKVTEIAPMVNNHHHCSRFFGFGNVQKAEPFERTAGALNGRRPLIRSFAALNAARRDACILSFILFFCFKIMCKSYSSFCSAGVAGVPASRDGERF